MAPAQEAPWSCIRSRSSTRHHQSSWAEEDRQELVPCRQHCWDGSWHSQLSAPPEKEKTQSSSLARPAPLLPQVRGIVPGQAQVVLYPAPY